MKVIFSPKYFLFLFVFFFQNIWAQDSLNLKQVQIDSLSVDYRSFNDESFDSYKNSPDYQYAVNPDYQQNFLKELWGRFKSYIWRTLFGEDGNVFSKVLIYGVIIAVLLLLLYHLLGLKSYTIFKSEDKNLELSLDAIDESSDSSTLKDLLVLALNSKDYRAATRIRYLQLLQHFRDEGIIEWKDFKTNMDFLQELKSAVTKESFREIVRIYENTWYGEHGLSPELFDSYDQMVSGLMNKDEG